MKKIECLSNFSSAGLNYYKGEVRFVTPEQAGHFCGCGWAKDLGGEIATGVPDLSPKKLDVKSGAVGNATEGVK